MVFVKILGPGQLTEQRIAEYEERSRGVVQDGKGSDITRLPEGRAAQQEYADHLLGLLIAGDVDNPDTDETGDTEPDDDRDDDWY